MIRVIHKESITEIDRAGWDQAAGDEYFLRWDYLRHVEQTMREGFIYHYLLITDDDRPLAAAPLFVMDLKLDTLLEDGWLRKIVQGIRKIASKAFCMRTLVIGSPPSVGNFGIAVNDGPCGNAVIRTLIKEAERISKEEKAGLILYKEMPSGFYERYQDIFKQAGIIFGHDMPNNHLALRWETDEEYLGAMRGKSRQAIRKSHNKLEQQGVEVRCLKDTETAIGDREYEMYLSVLMKSDNIFETLTKDYFATINAVKELEPCLIAVTREDTIIGYFLVCNSAPDEIAAMFAGLDYRWNHEYDVYFNLFHEVILHAMRNGKKGVCFGQNTYEVKQRMGCRMEDLYIGFRHRNPVLNRILAKMSPVLLPEITIKQRRVFK